MEFFGSTGRNERKRECQAAPPASRTARAWPSGLLEIDGVDIVSFRGYATEVICSHSFARAYRRQMTMIDHEFSSFKERRDWFADNRKIGQGITIDDDEIGYFSSFN